MYVGAHFPLDVVGGIALGWSIGSLVNYLLGRPHRGVSDRGTVRLAAAQTGNS
jgi:undecaprenyl-diphosphatase